MPSCCNKRRDTAETCCCVVVLISSGMCGYFLADCVAQYTLSVLADVPYWQRLICAFIPFPFLSLCVPWVIFDKAMNFFDTLFECIDECIDECNEEDAVATVGASGV